MYSTLYLWVGLMYLEGIRVSAGESEDQVTGAWRGQFYLVGANVTKCTGTRVHAGTRILVEKPEYPEKAHSTWRGPL